MPYSDGGDAPDRSACRLIDRRSILLGATIAVGSAAIGAEPLVRTSPIRWAGAGGRTLHGYMAIPGKAQGRQPAVLVIGEAEALPPVADLLARRLVDQVAAAGLLACTADNVTGLDDLRASLAWLRFNRYATGKIGLLAFGKGAGIAGQLASRDGDIVSALLILHAEVGVRGPVPTLVRDWRSGDPALPPGAAAFLKEHLA